MKLLQALLDSLSKKEYKLLVKSADNAGYHLSADTRSFLKKLKFPMKLPSQPTGQADFYKAVTGKRSFSISAWELLKSKVLEEVEQFLVCQKLFTRKRNYRRQVISVLEERGIKKNLRTHLNRYRAELEGRRLSTSYLEERVELESYEYNFSSDVEHSRTPNVSDLIHAVDLSYFGRKLKLSCHAFSHKEVAPEEFDLPILEELLEHLKHSDLLVNPLIGSYYFALLSFLGKHYNGISSYQIFKKTVVDMHQKIDLSDLRDLTILGVNYSIKMLRQGEDEFKGDILFWYQFGFENKALSVGQNVSPYTYRNAATIAIRLGDQSWAEWITESYKNFLPEESREVMYSFNMGRIAFSLEDYVLAREYLWNLEFEDVLLHIASKTLLMKIYFLIREYPLLDAAIESFRAYVRRKKIGSGHRSNYLRFAKYMKSLSICYQSNPDSRNIRGHKLLAQLNNDVSFSEREWFIIQLQNLPVSS